MMRQSFLSRERLRQKLKLSLNPGKVALEDIAGKRLRKRDIMQGPKTLCGASSYTAHHHYRILTGHSPSGRPTHSTYTECGPGARRFLNLLNKFSRKLSVTSLGQAAADAYSTLTHSATRACSSTPASARPRRVRSGKSWPLSRKLFLTWTHLSSFSVRAGVSCLLLLAKPYFCSGSK